MLLAVLDGVGGPGAEGLGGSFELGGVEEPVDETGPGRTQDGFGDGVFHGLNHGVAAGLDAVEFSAKEGETGGFKVEEIEVNEGLEDVVVVVVAEGCPFLDELGCTEVDVVGVG